MLAIAALVVGCGPSPQAAPPDDGPCAERIDPLRDDDRTPFGLRPNQVRAQLSGPREATLDGDVVTITPSWTGGLAFQVWSEATGEAPPDPPPPLWCQDRTELSARLRLEGADPRLEAFADGVVGRMGADGPLDDLRSGFHGELDGERAPELLPAGADPASTRLFVWAYFDQGRVQVRAGPDVSSTELVLELAL